MDNISSSPDRTRNQATNVRGNVVLLLMATAFMCHFNRISMPVAGNARIMEEYGIEGVTMGMVYSSYLLAYTLFMMPGGWVIDRLGAKSALVLMGLGSALCVAVTGGIGLLAIPSLVLPSLFVARSLLGVCSSPMHPGAARMVALWVPEQRRSRDNGLITAAALLGIAATYYLFGMLIDECGWPAAFMISGAATFVLTLAFLVYTTNSPAHHRRVNNAELELIVGDSSERVTAATPMHLFLRNRSLVLLTLSYVSVNYFQYLFFYWLEYYFNKVLDLSAETSRLYATIPNLAMAVGMFVGGWLADELSVRLGNRRGRMRVAVGGLVGGAVFLGLGVVAQEAHWIVLWFSLAMAAVGMSEGPFWVTAAELGGSQGGTSAAIFNTGGNLGGILAPVATPLLSSYFGWQGAMPVAGFFCLVGAALWFWINPLERVAPQPSRGVLE